MEPGPEDPLLGAGARGRDARAAPRTPLDARARISASRRRAPTTLLVTLADWDAIDARRGRRVHVPLALRTPSEADDPQALLDRARDGRPTARCPRGSASSVLSAGVVMNLLTAVLVFTVVVSAFGVLTTQGLAR